MDQPQVFSLLYVSTASVSVAMALADTMRDILVASDANNRRDGITGFLLSDGYSFVQLLEGPERQVQACFSRICADRRNSLPTVRDASWSDARLFPDWSMCALNLSGRDNLLLQPGDIGFDLFAASAGALRQHLLTLASSHGPDLLRAHAPMLSKPAKATKVTSQDRT
ncbi:BLUF domain-containing protein [Bradyrhizobium diazoefficiens]|uniref:BLUF domain-containing protein n=1 Tax=Bradyrhizobium diazoefficiens TaxID=1355477 RepID=UPI00272B63ED|nr:BLUF domain-containing protein [Bradyrhizobium diazoefficiens]WLA74210.1 BLUF domain-containing protein [Bradyrhizobium diazoefficiens]